MKINYPGKSTWTYRSFLNEVDLKIPPNDLELGDGTIHLNISNDGEISGNIGTPGEWNLELKGKVLETNPQGLYFIGTGENGQGANRAMWEYGYEVYCLPKIEGGKFQANVLAGSVVRLKDHPGSDGTIHKAGEVATCYAVDITKPA
ncbi:hypothetical protein [Chitinophaga sp. sic0106]|uniref:hypothetical protein n=1 Tax=Chitinophaga sp. sic0106 TaxID=2854785 RepID=UPI001C43B88C|nr:hypothetical protein [Chitinophaga sp. sic0106]MBV7530782.1 hypothetical protein [Chitinophaga sp. sic0106]